MIEMNQNLIVKKLGRFFRLNLKSYLLLGIASLQPVANFVQVNFFDQAFELDRAVLYFFVIFLFFSLLFSLIVVICKPRNSSFVGFAIAVAVLFIFNNYIIEILLNDLSESTVGIPLRFRHYIVIQAFLYLSILFVVRKIPPSSQFFSVFICSLAVLPVVDLATVAPYIYKSSVTKLVEFEVPAIDTVREPVSRTNKPNVYFLLPDGMPSPETVSDILGGYDYKITDHLRHRGFRFVENASSNDIETYMSIPHFFLMDYFTSHNETVSEETKVKLLNIWDGYNPVIEGFHSRGYRYYRAEGYYHVVRCSGVEDVCIRISSFFEPMDKEFFIKRTALHRIPDVVDALDPKYMEIPDLTKLLPAKEEGPFFLHAHFSIPHPPYRYTSDCSRKYYWVGSGDDPSLAEWRRLLGDQLTCAENQIKEFVNAVLTNDPEALIIIQSDHGMNHRGSVGGGSYLHELSSEEYRQMLLIFSAFHLPDLCASHLRPGLTPVNTFRIVFACLDGRIPDLLEDQTFVSKRMAIPVNGVWEVEPADLGRHLDRDIAQHPWRYVPEILVKKLDLQEIDGKVVRKLRP